MTTGNVVSSHFSNLLRGQIFIIALEGYFEIQISVSMGAMRSRDSSVLIVMGHGLKGPGSIPSCGKGFSRLHSVQTGRGDLPASPMGTASSFPRG
jgi:hypothetical protein